MSTKVHRQGVFGRGLVGLLFIRIQELTTTGSLLKSLAVGVGCFGLLMLLDLDAGGDTREPFQTIIGTAFALRFLPIFCLAKGGETLRNELKEGTIEYLWVRPISKIELYLGYYLSSVLSVLAILIPALVAISLAGLWLGVVDASGLLALWLTTIASCMAFCAISGALGSFSSKFVVFSLLYFGFIEMGLGNIPNGIQNLAVTYHAKSLLSGLTGLDSQYGDFSSYLWILGISGIMLVVGAGLFSTIRYVVGSDKDG